VTSWKGRFAGIAGGLALAAGGVASTLPTITAHAACGAFGVTGSGIGLDPIVSQSDFLAAPSASYNYAGVCGFNTGSATAPDGTTPEASFTIGLNAPIPTFPTLSRGDTGMTLTACADANGPIGTSVEKIGVGHRGQNIYDGPYPAEDGYKYCVDASLQLGPTGGQLLDYGVETFNPNGNFFFTDYPLLKNAAGTPTITPPLGMTATSTSVTLYLPKSEIFRVNAPAPPLQGVARAEQEDFIGATTQNAFVLTQVNAQVTLPFPVCVNLNPPGVSCGGTQLVGPIFGIVGLLVTSGWAPGSIACSAISGVPEPQTCGVTNTSTGTSNAVDLGVLPLPPNGQAIGTPCVDPLDVGAVDCQVVNDAPANYFPCQSSSSAPGGQDPGDLYAITFAAGAPCPVAGSVPLPNVFVSQYGLIWPGEPGIPRVPAPGGGGFTIGPAFLPTGVNF